MRSLLFNVGDANYSCPLDILREVVPFQTATRLPRAPSYVVGLINVRGTIVTVFDGSQYLQGVSTSVHQPMVILAEVGTHLVGLRVDRVMGVHMTVDDKLYPQLNVRDLLARLVDVPEDE